MAVNKKKKKKKIIINTLRDPHSRTCLEIGYSIIG